MCPSHVSAARAQRHTSLLEQLVEKRAWRWQWSARSRSLRNMAAARPASTSLASPPSKHAAPPNASDTSAPTGVVVNHPPSCLDDAVPIDVRQFEGAVLGGPLAEVALASQNRLPVAADDLPEMLTLAFSVRCAYTLLRSICSAANPSLPDKRGWAPLVRRRRMSNGTITWHSAAVP
jgi:hypothetical protein